MKSLPKASEPKFAHLAPDVWEALGNLKRTGWVDRGVTNPESVQDHVLSLMNLAASLEGLTDAEKDRLIDMLEVHDWPEAIHGDEVILAVDEEELRTLKATKFEKEQIALASICENLREKGEEIVALWLRFETPQDDAAAFARQLDKYQAIEKALECEKAQGIPLFREFCDYSKSRITHSVLLKRLEILEEEWRELNFKNLIK